MVKINHDGNGCDSVVQVLSDEPPWVSVGMPVFNGESFIAQAIDSILAQTYPFFEIIISDNASTDETEKICRGYAERDSRIRYIRQNTNLGATTNFRFVLDEARYQRFIWAAADDWWDRDRLERLVSSLGPNDAVVIGAIRRYLGEIPIAEFVPQPYRRAEWWKYLMREESRCEKVYFIYGLMWRDLTRKACAPGMDGYWGDAIFCYRLLWEGRLRSVPGATLHSLAHLQSEGAKQARTFRYSLARFFYRAHPWDYYKRYLEGTPTPYRKYVFLAILAKAFAAQVHLWFRAFSRLVLKRPYVHGRLAGSGQVSSML